MILVTATLDEQNAVACLRAGAENVVLENNLSRLGPVTPQGLSSGASPHGAGIRRVVASTHHAALQFAGD